MVRAGQRGRDGERGGREVGKERESVTFSEGQALGFVCGELLSLIHVPATKVAKNARLGSQMAPKICVWD